MCAEKSENGRGRPRQTFSLSVPKDKLARLPEGARVSLKVDGIIIEARKRAGRLVRDRATGQAAHHGRSSRTASSGSFVRVDAGTGRIRSSTKKPLTPPKGLRQALVDRLTQLVDRFPEATVTTALGQDDVGTFTTLASPEAWGEERISPTEGARLRGVKYRDELLERAGGGLSVAAVAKMLGVSEEAIRKRLRARTLVGIKGAGGYLIPAVQFDEGSELAGLRKVLEVMPVESSWMRLNWLMSPEPRLDDRKPVEVLRQGRELDAVIAAAALYGEQGAA